MLSPADGRVLVAGPAVADAAPPPGDVAAGQHLSVADGRARQPHPGVRPRDAASSYTPGRFLPAYRHDAGGANERSEIWIDHGGQTIVARQIVGMLARRVVCRVAAGAEVRAGDRFGIMKFGSRMDVFLPLDADAAGVKVGETVRGGETVIAVLH